MNKMEPSNWYVVYTYPNIEKRIYNELHKRDITAFLPTVKVVRQWSDRKKNLEVPLFPNYLFVKVTPRKMWTVLTVSGVVRFISFNGTPTIVKDVEIGWVEKLMLGSGIVAGGALVCKGDKVRVKQGPLSGLLGRVSNEKGKGLIRVYVQLEALHQVVSVEIDAGLLQKVD